MDRLKILVVDDESRMRKLVRDFLVKHDFDVVEAGDGEAALDLFYDDKDIALIILDVMMPKMNGWEVCREIRESSKVPIIMLTAKSDESDELMGFELGVDEYISKPFSPKILVARVEAILRRTNQLNMEGSLNVGGICLDKNAHTVTIDGYAAEYASIGNKPILYDIFFQKQDELTGEEITDIRQLEAFGVTEQSLKKFKKTN